MCIRDRCEPNGFAVHRHAFALGVEHQSADGNLRFLDLHRAQLGVCLLYTSDVYKRQDQCHEHEVGIAGIIQRMTGAVRTEGHVTGLDRIGLLTVVIDVYKRQVLHRVFSCIFDLFRQIHAVLPFFGAVDIWLQI